MKIYCDKKRHLVCTPYSVENLHEMARRLGIKKWWYHSNERGLNHYDIPKRREKEIMAKATVVKPRDIVNIIRGTWQD